MRRIVPAVALLLLAACSFEWNDDANASGPGVPASGSGRERTYAVSGFDAVELRGSDDVDVRVGAGFSVRAEGDPDLLDRLRIVRDGDTLRIGRTDATGWSLMGNKGKLRVMVTMPRIAGAGVAGSGHLAVDRAEGVRFHGSVAGSGGLAVSALQVDEASLSIAGSGGLRAAGNARRLSVEVAGSGALDMPGLAAEDARLSIAGSGNVRAGAMRHARIDVSGSGNVRADVRDTADVSVSGSGNVDLGGTARCTVRKAGSGSVRCGVG